MPIVEKDEDVIIEYSIPEDIKSRIPDYFYIAMAGELCSIFGAWIFKEHDGYYDLCTNTGGWYVALKATCMKLDMMWLVKYWDSLEWYDSDLFDAEVETEIVERFCKQDIHANCYLEYLCKKGE